MIEKDDYSFSNQESAKISMEVLGKKINMSWSMLATAIIQTSSFEITKEITKIIKEFKMNSSQIKLIGGGGGASVLIPFVAKQLNLTYEKADFAEVISSIGVASSMMQEQLEQTITNPNPEQISDLHKKIHSIMIEKGASPESISIDSQYVPEKSLLRVSAIGNVEFDNRVAAKNVFTLDEAKHRASEIIKVPTEQIELSFETDHYFVFTGHMEIKKLLGKKSKHHILVLDRFGREKLSIKNGVIFQGGNLTVLEQLDNFLGSENDISPQVYLLNELKLVDYSGLTSKSHILEASKKELTDSVKAAIIIETK